LSVAPWSEQDIAQIKKLAGKLSLRELADKLDRSDEATRAKASKLGVCLQSEAPAVPGEKPVAAKAQTQTATLVETVVAPLLSNGHFPFMSNYNSVISR
jgi:hypothetical protein